MFKLTKDTRTSPLQASYGMSFVSSLEKSALQTLRVYCTISQLILGVQQGAKLAVQSARAQLLMNTEQPRATVLMNCNHCHQGTKILIQYEDVILTEQEIPLLK